MLAIDFYSIENKYYGNQWEAAAVRFLILFLDKLIVVFNKDTFN